jgi:hypothetical protein
MAAMNADMPAITNEDAIIDRAWFDDHPRRSCYARAYRPGLVLIVRQITQRDQAPVLLRVWGELDRVPEDEASCLALWQRCAYP